MFNINSQNNKGISLYFGLIIMAIFLAVALGLITILIGQIGIMRGMGNSVVAFYAADSGIEKTLMLRESLPPYLGDILSNGAEYSVTVTAGGGSGCDSSFNYCITSIGSFLETKRAIEITY
jgi:hypothetical protein